MNNQQVIRKSMTALLALVTLLMLVAPAETRNDKAAQGGYLPNALAQEQGPTNPAELESFLDELMAKDMEEHHIAGAVISVVKDGEIFFAKGYGYADLEQGLPVNPEQTMFAIGSVSNLFTWTAVMQLVELGKLDLDTDVNSYLDFRIPSTYPEPITLKNLLAHTSGFENLLIGSLVFDARDLVPVHDWMVSHIPARVRPPGSLTGYSHYNAMLAGYIVARATGQPYDQYIQEHVLAPLGMVHSTAQSPMPPDLRAHLATGYMYVDGALAPVPDYVSQPGVAPSGALRTSATDMALFMIAHLEDGGGYSASSSSDVRILKEATLRLMHSTLYRPDERMLGTAYGFFDLSDGGHWAIGHRGNYPPMHSLVLLMPDKYLGIFVAYNSDSGALTFPHIGFQRAFFDHYFPGPTIPAIQPPADSADQANRFVGSYRTAETPETTLAKIMELRFGTTIEISDHGDGTLLLTTNGHNRRFVELGSLYFRQEDGPFSIVFHEDERGHIDHMATDLTPTAGAIKLEWYETRGVNIALALTCVLIFLSMIPVAVVRFIRYRRLGIDRKPALRGASFAQWVILGICILNLLFLAGTVLWGWPGSELLSVLTIYQLVLGLGVLSSMLTVGALVYMLLAWKNSYWGIGDRAHYTLVTIAAVAFVWFLNYWNLLGWRF